MTSRALLSPSADRKAGIDVVEGEERPELVIEPPRGLAPLDLGELWAFRELLLFLVWRDVKVRYKQTVLGAAWAILQPFMTMVVFSVFFGRLAKMPSDGVPYPLFAYAALVPWTFFAHGLAQAAESLVGSANLIKKVYFPRLVIPLSGVLSGLFDLAVAALVLIAMMAYFGVRPAPAIATLPIFLVLAVVSSLGVGLWLSALNVQFRDVRYTIGFLTQFWLFATPVAYPSSLLSEPWRSLSGLNPMAGVVEGFRFALLGTPHPPIAMLAVSALVAAAVLVSGALYFRRMESTFADVA